MGLRGLCCETVGFGPWAKVAQLEEREPGSEPVCRRRSRGAQNCMAINHCVSFRVRFFGAIFFGPSFLGSLFLAGETRYSCNITRLTVIMIRGSGQAAFIPQLIPLYWHVTHTVWEQPFEVMCAIGSFGKVVGPS